MPSQHTLGGAAAASLLDSNIPYDIFIRNLKLLRAGRVIVDFEIILEKNRVLFYGPPNKNKSRTVRGKVRLEVAGRLNVKEIMITLAGEFHITNENSVTSTSTSDDIPLQGTLFSTCILLENKRTLAPGVHEFFFEFRLPGDLPGSMSSDLILCEYFLKAELTIRGPGEFSPQNKIVDVVDLYVQRAMLQTDPSIKPYLDITRYTGSKDKILDFEFILPKMMGLNTDVLTLHARWDGLRVDNVKFWFVQTESFKDLESTEEEVVQDVPTDRKTKIISGPYCFEMPKKEPLKLQSRPMFFQLPITEPFVGDYDLYNVEITHQLIISIQMANKNKENIQLSIPIIIESIVENTEMVPPPCHISQSDQEASLQFANKIYYGSFLENNNNQQKSPPKRLTRAERKKETEDLNKSTAESVQTNEQTTIRVPRRTSSHIFRRNSSINNNDVNVINLHNSIGTINESASEFSNENSNTIATTATYTNNTDHERNAHGFSQKGSQKPTLVIAEKINNLLRNRSNRRSVSMNKRGTKRTSRASSSASAVKFAPPGLLEVFSRFPNANVNNGSLTT